MNRERDTEQRDPGRWFWPALAVVATGWLWLAIGWSQGPGFGLLASVPGTLLLATGTALFLWPGDRQITHFMAFGAVCSLLLALPAAGLGGLLAGLVLVGLSLLCFWLAGYAALYQDALPDDVPAPVMGARMVAKVALDEALLAYFVATARLPSGARLARDVAEIRQLNDIQASETMPDAVGDWHRAPPAPDAVRMAWRRAGGHDFEHLRFESGFRPDADLPGAARWADYAGNHEMHAWVMRHDDGPRPWLMGIHGYRMGEPMIDFSLFDVDYLHRRLGLNLILPILPLHGPRRAYKRSGSGYLDGQLVDVLHAQSQAAWDLRRCLAWIRDTQQASRIGVLGYSLGGYNTALLAGLEADLACVIAGIPLADIPAVTWRHMPLLQQRQLEAGGLCLPDIQNALRPVSPLALPPRVAHARRFIFAATGDQLVPPEQPQRLWHHWGQPACHWYQGAHLSVRREAGVRAFVADALVRSGLAHDAPDGQSLTTTA